MRDESPPILNAHEKARLDSSGLYTVGVHSHTPSTNSVSGAGGAFVVDENPLRFFSASIRRVYRGGCAACLSQLWSNESRIRTRECDSLVYGLNARISTDTENLKGT